MARGLCSVIVRGLGPVFVPSLMLVLLLLVPTAGEVGAIGAGETAPDDEEAREMAGEMAGDITVLNGDTLGAGAQIRARGRVAVYGNAPFTFRALRTEADRALLEDDQRPGGDSAVVPLLFELAALEAIGVEAAHAEGAVVITGVVTRMPQGPRQGELQVERMEQEESAPDGSENS